MQLFGGRERQTPPQNALGEFAGPKLHFRRTKQILGIKQIPYEHLIIPKEDMRENNRRVFEGFAANRRATNSILPMLGFLGCVFLNMHAVPPNAMLTRLVKSTGGFLWAAGASFKLMDFAHMNALHEHLTSLLDRGFLPGKAYELNEETGKYEPSAKLIHKLSKMTHWTVDNQGNLLLARHPLDGVAKAQTARERWENLRKWIQWRQPFQRYRFELRPPRRYERETVPAKLAATLKPVKISSQ